MFEISAARSFATDGAQVQNALPQAVYEASAAQMVQMQPGYWQGRSVGSVWGMQAEVTVHTMATPQGAQVHVTVGAEVAQNPLIVIALLCFFFFPAAILLGIVAYNDFSSRRLVVMEGVFARLATATGTPALVPSFGRLTSPMVR
jgi:hypothetical protein